MGILLALITYFAYLFIIGMYTAKAVKFLKAPLHMRWDLYPVLHEEHYRYGGSYYEDEEWWTKKRRKHRLRGLLRLVADNFYLGDYFTRHRSYWLALYPWHLGFILIISFHICCFLAAVAMVLGLTIGPYAGGLGAVFYYVTLLTAVPSFILGSIGSMALLLKRSTDEALKRYAGPLNYFNYLFFLVVFLSGLYAWHFDPTFSEYREFWKALITLHQPHVQPAAAAHILLFSLFLIYLPYTRSMHYISRFLAFFMIRWDDEPNTRGSAVERKVSALLKGKVTWSAAHIQSGGTWAEVATEVPVQGQGEGKK